MARPLGSVAPTGATVAAGSTFAGTDSQWYKLLDPGSLDDTYYLAFSFLEIQNDTDADLDFGFLTTNSVVTPSTAAKTRLITLKAHSAPYTWDLAADGDSISGPIYARGFSAQATAGNVFAGGRLA